MWVYSLKQGDLFLSHCQKQCLPEALVTFSDLVTHTEIIIPQVYPVDYENRRGWRLTILQAVVDYNL